MSPSRIRRATSPSGSGFSLVCTSSSIAMARHGHAWAGSANVALRRLVPAANSPISAAFRMDEVRLKRLRFRAWRRGFLEADLVLGPFADSHAHSLTEIELAAFERLLDRTDHDVYGWIVQGGDPPDDDEALLVSRIRAFHASPTGQGDRA
jgi:antitoxin CptB